jgi:hypothetical protein
MPVTPDTEPLAQVGSSPLERIYQQLVIQTYILKQIAGITDEDYTFFTQPTNMQINPNFSELL